MFLKRHFCIFLIIFYLHKSWAINLPRKIDRRKFNIVWFMIEPSSNTSLHTDVPFKCLSFCRSVKPCTIKTEGRDLLEPEENQLARIKKPKNACDCQIALKQSIKTFLEWVQHNMKMSIASVMVNIPPNSETQLRRYVKGNKSSPGKLQQKSLHKIYHRKGNYIPKVKNRPVNPQISRYKRDDTSLDIPIIEIFNPEPKIVFNNEIERFPRYLHDVNDKYDIARNAVTVLKDDNFEQDKEFENMENNTDQENIYFMNTKTVGRPKIPRLFESFLGGSMGPPNMDLDTFDLYQLVVQTMDQLISIENPLGYVALIRGGKLGDLGDKYSPIAKSINYVTTMTDETDSLILVSMECPDRYYVDNCSSIDSMLPIYCSGPHCIDLEEAEELKDIADILQRSLSEGFDSDKTDTVGANERRLAKTLVETIYYDDNNADFLPKIHAKRSAENNKNRRQGCVRNHGNDLKLRRKFYISLFVLIHFKIYIFKI